MIDALLEDREALREALEFYGDGNSWYRPTTCDESERANYNCSRLPRDLTEAGVGPYGLAGAQAREAIAASDARLLKLGEGK